jgi:Ca2+-binding RTX toxin-like protein
MSADPRRRPAPALTPLDDRCLPSAVRAYFADGVLTVRGTDRADDIRVYQAGGEVRVEGARIRTTETPASYVGGMPAGVVRQVRISAGGGDDRVRVGGLAVGAVVLGGAGDDTIWGGAGADRLDGQAGADRVWGGAGADRLSGGEGGDYLAGGDGDDTLNGGAGQDELWGQAGGDLLLGRDGGRFYEWDFLVGGPGDDVLRYDDDFVWGGAGADHFDRDWRPRLIIAIAVRAVGPFTRSLTTWGGLAGGDVDFSPSQGDWRTPPPPEPWPSPFDVRVLGPD